MKKTIKLALLALPFIGITSIAKADNYGCEALLCFAGGKNVSECQPTIKRVLKDLSKGKGFPHCNFVNFNGSSSGTSENMVSTRLYTERSRSPVCRDGQTRATRSFMGYYCRTIEINIAPEYAADAAHQKQYFNY